MTQPPRRIAWTVGTVSCALILFQISFTRLVGYKLFYHFVFLAIALSLLGLGAAGTYAAVRPQRGDLEATLHRWLAALIAAVPLCFLMMANPFVLPASGTLGIKLVGSGAVVYLVWCALGMVALNFLGGVVLTRIFAAYSAAMGALYARDLVGAAIGCLVCLAAMKYGSPPLAFLASTALLVAAWLPLHIARPQEAPGVRSAALAAAAGVGLAAALLLWPAAVRDFGSTRGTTGREIVKYEWNHIIRTDHAADGQYVLDGEASTQIADWSPAEQVRARVEPAYTLVPPAPEVAVIGFGGGPQVAEARRHGASRILAIDINPTLARWVLGDDRALNAGLFEGPGIEVRVGEGRHLVRSSDRPFDVITLHAIDTYAATAAGAYALTENFLYTQEAFNDYMDALKPWGVLTVQRWLFNPPRENLRLFATALEALAARGEPRPEQHVIMIAPTADYESLRTHGTRIWGYLLVSPGPFTAERVATVRAHVEAMRWTILYAPGVPTDTPFAHYVAAADKDAFQAGYPYIISPVSDARPYLFQFYHPLRGSSWRREADWAVSAIYQSSASLLLVALVLAVVLSLLIIIAPLYLRGPDAAAGAAAARLTGYDVVYFAGLGVGFMALEVPLTQVLSLYLGHPTYGFSVVLVALLLSAGAGSLVAQRVSIARFKVCALVAVVLAEVTLFIFPLAHRTIDLPAPVRFTLVLTAACGLPMGMPLALAIRRLTHPRAVAWAWAVNGATSVVGSTVVMILMVFAGAHAALAAGSACYAAAALAAWRIERDAR